MTLSSKTSRPLCVDGRAYRWSVSRPDRERYLRLLLEDQETPGRLAIARLGPFTSTSTIPSITPAIACSFVRHVTRRGWNPRTAPNKTTYEDFRLTRTESVAEPSEDGPVRLETWSDLDRYERKYPWDHHVGLAGVFRLDASISDKQVGSVLAALASDAGVPHTGKRVAILQELDARILTPDAYEQRLDDPGIEAFHRMYLRGGRVLSVGGAFAMGHGCCSTIDEWIEWKRFANGGHSPWNGHNPWTTAFMEDGHVAFDSDGDANLRVTLDEYRRMVDAMEQDLRGFVERFAACLASLSTEDTANSLVNKVQTYLHLQ